MNDNARAVLIDAAMRGVKQIKGWYHDDAGGRCAIGVLCEAAGTDWGCIPGSLFDLSLDEAVQIMRANDDLGWDFLTIARKIGVPEETK